MSLPKFFELKDSDFGLHFMGKCLIRLTDEYNTQSAGTIDNIFMARSVLNTANNTITLYSFFNPDVKGHGFSADGTFGVSGFIYDYNYTYYTNASNSGEPKVTDTLVFRLQNIPKNVVQKDKEYLGKDASGRDCYKVTGRASIDNLVFNLNDEYTYQSTYYIRKSKSVGGALEFVGAELTLPVDTMNLFISNRDLYYKSYKGMKPITF